MQARPQPPHLPRASSFLIQQQQAWPRPSRPHWQAVLVQWWLWPPLQIQTFLQIQTLHKTMGAHACIATRLFDSSDLISRMCIVRHPHLAHCVVKCSAPSTKCLVINIGAVPTGPGTWSGICRTWTSNRPPRCITMILVRLVNLLIFDWIDFPLSPWYKTKTQVSIQIMIPQNFTHAMQLYQEIPFQISSLFLFLKIVVYD